MNYLPENDGIDHINVYSKGKTRLGRLLSNFAYSPIELSEHGKFNSIEGYWYWLLCEPSNSRREELRKLYGWKAKQLGRELKVKDWPIKDESKFRYYIEIAIMNKIANSKDIQQLLNETHLPFTHYYVYGSKVINVPQADWILEILQKAKNIFNGLCKPCHDRCPHRED